MQNILSSSNLFSQEGSPLQQDFNSGAKVALNSNSNISEYLKIWGPIDDAYRKELKDNLYYDDNFRTSFSHHLDALVSLFHFNKYYTFNTNIPIVVEKYNHDLQEVLKLVDDCLEKDKNDDIKKMYDLFLIPDDSKFFHIEHGSILHDLLTDYYGKKILCEKIKKEINTVCKDENKHVNKI